MILDTKKYPVLARLARVPTTSAPIKRMFIGHGRNIYNQKNHNFSLTILINSNEF